MNLTTLYLSCHCNTSENLYQIKTESFNKETKPNSHLLSLWTLSSRSPTIPSLYKLNNQQTYHQRTHEFATLFKSALFMLQTQFTSPDSRSQFWWDVKQIAQMRVNYSLGLPMPLQENSGTEGWLSLNLQPPILSTQPWWPQSKQLSRARPNQIFQY